MYGERYGTDWDALDAEDAIERAYALGVLAGVDEPRPEEYERVRAAAGDGPAGDMVELAYEEGEKAAVGIDEAGREDGAAWRKLIENGDGRSTRAGEDASPDGEAPPPSAPPSSLSALEPRDDDPGMFDLPEFLRGE